MPVYVPYFSFSSQEQYRGLETILKKCLKLLKALARGNDLVQLRMFERLDNLLRIKVVEADLAIALKEVRPDHFTEEGVCVCV